jgi:hypothetical protein
MLLLDRSIDMKLNMTKTFAGLALVLIMSTPALAEGDYQNDGLPYVARGQIAPGLPRYDLDSSGHWVKTQDVNVGQSADTSQQKATPISQRN